MKYFSRWSGIVGGVALGRVMKQYPGVAEAIARALGEHVRELLSPGPFRVEVRGPILDVKWGAGSSASGIVGLGLLERGTPEEKLERVFRTAGRQLQPVIESASSTLRPAGMNHARAEFEPHVRITSMSVELWWGGESPDAAVTRIRPISRSELGL